MKTKGEKIFPSLSTFIFHVSFFKYMYYLIQRLPNYSVLKFHDHFAKYMIIPHLALAATSLSKYLTSGSSARLL